VTHNPKVAGSNPTRHEKRAGQTNRSLALRELALSIETVERFVEHSDDVRVSTLRQYLEAFGARLEFVAVFDDEERRVRLHLGKGGSSRVVL
jgi:hypothetical protein